MKANDFVKIETAIISTHDKTGIKYFATELVKLNPSIKIISSGGTFKELEQVVPNSLAEVSKVTGFPEMPSGLVKTLHPKIHGAILSTEEDHEFVSKHGIGKIDLVVVNLYPFREASKSQSIELARSNIDIGGVSLLEAGSKNFLRVTVLSDPMDYEHLLTFLRSNDCQTNLATRLKHAKRAMANLQTYFSSISEYFDNLMMEDVGKEYFEK